ncbi:uncharacterized protein LOC106530641 [Austrofundulus limnaeus]|uniref:Uncharacterized protein LOC106530641 n=1 Tax=Austrofundulus limnaeus TaxID=52670 RepID=A0A2I4CP48_AUSLI|nr:PREDICTED: uncharacterized protein LOC106530641 [Austrofundulus limnaeus]
MTQPTFQTCLTDKTTESFQTCNKNMIEQIKKVYTTIEGFDTLTINAYSLGSIIVSFGITIVSNLKPQDLIDRSIELSKILNGSFELQTTGLVEVTVPSGLVHYHTDATVNCKTKEDLGAQPLWNINNGNGVFLITNGTVSTVSTQQKQSTVTLQQVDELWEGVYICLFVQQNSSVTIYHTANATMNICLIPKIRNSTNTAYPRCKSADDVLLVTIICEIDKTSENYTVTWSEYASAGRNTFGKNILTCLFNI